MTAVQARSGNELPVTLPLELSASIFSVLHPGSQPPQEPPPIEEQLSQLFPDDTSLCLSNIQAVQGNFRAQIDQEQAETALLVKELEEEQRVARMSNVQEGIGALLAQLSLIREKARESETVVHNITRDIRSLDTAKKNVVQSMTVLKRLQMLASGTQQLARLTQNRNYRDAAHALEAVKALQDFFKDYMSIMRIAELWKQVNELQQKLREMAMGDYEKHLLHDPTNNVRSTPLPDAAMLIDAAGSEATSSLVDWYASLQLREYRRIFRATDEAGQLDNVARRYAWFKRVLKSYEEEHADAFLPAWDVGRALVARFSDVTKDDLKSVLVREQSRLQVATLLEAFTSTMDFEAQLSKRFNRPFKDLANPIAPTPSSSSAATMPTISSVFDPYLAIYVDAQDKTLAEMMSAYRRAGPINPRSGSGSEGHASADPGEPDQHTVLPSSTELFYFYRQTLEQCALLSNRKPFRDLCSVFKKWLRIYANDVLRQSLIRMPGGDRTRLSQDSRPNAHDVQRWCLVINTSDYCATTSLQLEEKLRQKMHSDFRDGLTLEPEREQFLGVISSGVMVLTRELEESIDRAFNQMLRPPQGWAARDETIEKSSYIDDVASALEQVAVIVRQDVENKRYVRMWSDKAVGVVTSRFGLCIVKLKPVSCNAARQLLVDIAEIKTMLLELPRYSPEALNGAIASSYVRYVEKAVSRIVLLLEVLETPESPAESLVNTYISQIGDRSMANFQKVLELRGVRRVDQNALIDHFVNATASSDELSDTSFLTALDLEASLQPLGQAPQPDVTQGLGTPPLGSGTGSNGRNSLHLNRQGSNSQYDHFRESSGLRSPTPGEAAQGNQAGGVGGRAFSDLRRFGTLFGAALGRRRGEMDDTT
ncbi:hypothetical protein K437DRAFT_254784 [Tilletiaria anomala UBC 951]|uniref:Uncharacterized protein n=1 Tax=Tilletiaria anomala (strain ATCC 24038 / CBS 436.72 / UBC 951) TaxID=1037660 RepID=A0A066WBT3_TILAU|nr:uncharacterized protein K437DRAFT_254784 [Tilletiaria anomala UBC 951]KDN51377.1 hypothetical protein K437DRAFT_254784 [Tilletiaria anomala UBC 951]